MPSTVSIFRQIPWFPGQDLGKNCVRNDQMTARLSTVSCVLQGRSVQMNTRRMAKVLLLLHLFYLYP